MRREHMADFKEDLAIELWVLYSLGLTLIACRLAARRILLRSFRKYQADDYLMVFVVFTFTGVFVSTFQVAHNGSNYVYLAPGATELLTQKEKDDAILGSKWALVLEEFTLTTLWLIKACILLLYGRLTLGLRQNIAVKILAAYCVLGFILIQVLLLGVWCKPINQYWAVPPTSTRQCATYYRHMIVASVFNMSSDLLMLLIPLPLLVTSKLPIKRKLIVCGVFSLGIFVILAAVLNRYYNFTIKYSLIFLNWYVGEISTAVFVANLPLCWPLFRRVFAVGSFVNSRGSRSNEQQSPGQRQSDGTSRRSMAQSNKKSSNGKGGKGKMSSNTRSVLGVSERGRGGFWESSTVDEVDLGDPPADLEHGIVEDTILEDGNAENEGDRPQVDVEARTAIEESHTATKS